MKKWEIKTTDGEVCTIEALNCTVRDQYFKFTGEENKVIRRYPFHNVFWVEEVT